MAAPKHFSKTLDYRQAFGWQIWRRLRSTAVQAEYRHYRRLQALGIPCPGDVTYRDHRNFIGLLNYATLSMARLEQATDLRYIMCFNEYAELRADRGFRRALARELARWVRTMHEKDFFHGRLTFRNVLVRLDQPAQPQVHFIGLTDCRYRPPATEREARRLGDLAALWWDARKWCTWQEIGLFLHEYTGHPRFTAADRELARAVTARAKEEWRPPATDAQPAAS